MEVKWLQDVPPWEWPKDTRDLLKKTLRDRRSPASDRLIAVQMAGDLVVMDDQMASLLLDIVRSAEEAVELRAKAAISFGPALEQSFVDEFDDEFGKPPINKKTFDRIQQTLRNVYFDGLLPKQVRRKALEASVRAPQDWHRDAIRTAYASGDEEWKLTAVFGMRWVGGFDPEILETLDSPNPDIHYEAVQAAGAQAIAAAWPHIAALLASESTAKPLLLAAIEASASVCPAEARLVLADMAGSEDEDIADAVDEALLMADVDLDEDEDEDDDDIEDVD
ncbi:MAG: hypothetical protein ACLQVN_12070 [Bryobacteraceae bacterium]